MLINQKIFDYIHKYTTPEDRVLQELYRETHVNILHPHMLAGHFQGKILEMLSKMISPENILEIGTYTGYSAICLAKGLPEGGKVHTIERNDELMGISQKYFKKAGVGNRIIQYTGEAREIIPKLDFLFGLVYIDCDKDEYLHIYNQVFDKVPSGGYILADNALWEGKVAEKHKPDDKETSSIIEFNNFIKNDNRVENVILPIRDGLMIIRKIS